MALIGPSLMCADLGILRECVQLLDHSGVDYYHLDIMDGNFVPNYSMGPDILKSLRPYTNKPFDVHLMVKEPERYIDMFADAGANMISIHAEATIHLERTIQLIRQKGLKAGVALNPSTPLGVLEYVLDITDYVCLMTVNPGFAGQSFIPSIFRKISQLKQIIEIQGTNTKIQVDGNISFATIPKVIKNGAYMLVCGTSSLFRGDGDIENAVAELRNLVSL